MKRAPHLVGDRVDSLALGTAVVMVDAVALIVPPHEAGPDEFRNRSAHVRAPGETDSLLNLRGDQLFGGGYVGWKLIALLELRSNFPCDRKTAGIPPGDRSEGIAEPVPHRHLAVPVTDVGAAEPLCVLACAIRLSTMKL